MGNIIKSIGSFIIGISIFLGLIFVALFLIKGGVWLGGKVVPVVSTIMGIVFWLDIIIILPLGIFKKTRGISAIGLVISSFCFGLTLWLDGLLLTYQIWGSVAVFVGLFIAGIGVVPIAILATAIEGQWTITGEIVLLLVLTFGSRALGLYFAKKTDESNHKSSSG